LVEIRNQISATRIQGVAEQSERFPLLGGAVVDVGADLIEAAQEISHKKTTAKRVSMDIDLTSETPPV
jgi:hypothetical protein